MTFKRPLPIYPTPTKNMDFHTDSNTDNLCKICGEKPYGKNYGVLSCSSCKIFFRRYGFHSKNIRPCDLDNNCEITILSRKVCTACRFAKCLAVGMNPELIRKEDLSKTLRKQKQLTLTQSFSSASPTILNLLSTDQSSLTTLDWTLVSNVVHAFDTFTPVLKARSIVEHINTQFGMEQSLNLMACIYSSLESFINSTADFRIMTIDEQRSLIQRNMHGLWGFHASFIFRESGVFNNLTNEKAIIPLYGSRNVHCTKRFAIQLDYDLTIIKLMLITLTFSSNLFTLTKDENMSRDSLLYGTFRLFGSQNVYVEILWKYMIYRYGFSESVKRFAVLIKILLDILQLASDINDSNSIHHTLADQLIDQTERSLRIDDEENVSLWGKT